AVHLFRPPLSRERLSRRLAYDHTEIAELVNRVRRIARNPPNVRTMPRAATGIVLPLMARSHDHGAPQHTSTLASPTLTRDLLARYLAGDLDAERKLFERHRQALIAKARSARQLRAVERDVTAEDVVQEVMWRVLSSGMLRTFEDRGRGSLEA